MLTLAEQVAVIDSKIAAQEKGLLTLRKQRNALLEQTSIECPECRKVEQIKNIPYIQTHWYTPPRGCSDGDYWTAGEGQIDCTGCGARLRLYKHPEIEALKHLFKTVVNEYKG